MDKNYFIKLTTNLYRLTMLFPKKEPLRRKIRELADEVLASSVLFSQDYFQQSKASILELEKDLEVLDAYLELAKNQNWVSPFDILEIQKEYIKIRKAIANLATIDSSQKKIAIFEDKVPLGLKEVSTDLVTPIVKEETKEAKVSRQEKILDFLKTRGRAQVGDLKNVFPQVSKRTLRRDFELLLKKDLVERIGEKSNTFYKLKSRT